MSLNSLAKSTNMRIEGTKYIGVRFAGCIDSSSIGHKCVGRAPEETRHLNGITFDDNDGDVIGSTYGDTTASLTLAIVAPFHSRPLDTFMAEVFFQALDATHATNISDCGRGWQASGGHSFDEFSTPADGSHDQLRN